MTEKLSTTSFEEQYKNAKNIESYGGAARYLDIRPEFSNGELPILVASGWSEGRKSFHDTAKEIYSENLRVLLVDHARNGRVPEDSSVNREIEHKANTLLGILDDTGIDKVNVIAHSEGTLNTIAAAIRKPEQFNVIILAMPAGLIGKDSVLKLAGRFVPKLARSISKDTYENPRIGTAVNVGGAAYIVKNPAKAAREVSAMANTTIDEVLGELREKGIKIGVLQSHSDTIFPDERIEKHIRLDGPFANVDSYASVVAKDAGHDDLMIHPERATRGALQMIGQFNN